MHIYKNSSLEENLFFMKLEAKEKKQAEYLENSNSINLNAEGEELRQILANLQGEESISNRDYNFILHCMDRNNWNLEEIIEHCKYKIKIGMLVNISSFIACDKADLLNYTRKKMSKLEPISTEIPIFNDDTILNDSNMDDKFTNLVLSSTKDNLNCPHN